MVGIGSFSPPFLLIESGFADKEQFCVGLKGSLVCCSIQHKPCAVEAFTPVSVDRHRALSASRILPARPTKYRYTNKQKHKYKNTQIRILPPRAAKVRPSVSISGSTYRQSSILWSWSKVTTGLILCHRPQTLVWYNFSVHSDRLSLKKYQRLFMKSICS